MHRNSGLVKKVNCRRYLLAVPRNYKEDYLRGSALRKAKTPQLKTQLIEIEIQYELEDCCSGLIQIADALLVKHNKPFQD